MSTKTVKSCTGIHHASAWAGAQWEQPGQKVTVVLVGNKLSVSQKCVHAVMMANHTLGCTTTRVASRLREGKPHLE